MEQMEGLVGYEVALDATLSSFLPEQEPQAWKVAARMIDLLARGLTRQKLLCFTCCRNCIIW